MALKDKIIRALDTSDYLSEKDREMRDARIACRWLVDIKNGKQLTSTDRPDATPHELDVVNDIIDEIASLKRIAMSTLPASSQETISSTLASRRP
jgi:hypothetical protein